MKKGKLVVIAGTDSSGKETQTRLLVEKLKGEGVPVATMSFPRYDTPTGRIIGGPYLGKPKICESWFPDGPDNVDPKAASLLYAADRRLARPEMLERLADGQNLILDRYVSANMGHQGGKIRDPKKREDFYHWLHTLEHDLLELPIPDQTIFLYMPLEVAMELRQGRGEEPDGHESNTGHLRNAEEAYLQLATLFNWRKISCAPEGNLRRPEEIHKEVYNEFMRTLLSKK